MSQECCRIQFADSNQTIFRELNIQELPPPEGMKINEMRCECWPPMLKVLQQDAAGCLTIIINPLAGSNMPCISWTCRCYDITVMSSSESRCRSSATACIV